MSIKYPTLFVMRYLYKESSTISQKQRHLDRLIWVGKHLASVPASWFRGNNATHGYVTTECTAYIIIVGDAALMVVKVGLS